ncbi:class I SAM-dependent methyltransferase [Chitinibacter sp. GC72]|uniref:class I SAM-dependent methyltransferase n=1 Tax=Chitinibacter sp. GC72 TaxID=1526917 RepID=UPI0012FB6FD6|nr:class I SAM-dependent methyltransferase [Chitinibacter sp. GC72]
MSVLTIDVVQKIYKYYAPFYYFIFGFSLEHGRKVLGATLSQQRFNNILEIGVGTGMLLRHYPFECQVVGVDICEPILALAQKEANKIAHPSISLMMMDAENMHFPDESFDCVVLPYVLSVTPDPEALIAEARRVCKNGGHIFILNHFSGGAFLYRAFECILAKFPSLIGFRSDFCFKKYVLDQPWEILDVCAVNFGGLSKFVTVRNVK